MLMHSIIYIANMRILLVTYGSNNYKFSSLKLFVPIPLNDKKSGIGCPTFKARIPIVSLRGGTVQNAAQNVNPTFAAIDTTCITGKPEENCPRCGGKVFSAEERLSGGGIVSIALIPLTSACVACIPFV